MILNRLELKDKILKLKSNNKKTVFTNGCFDILHLGHHTYLKQSSNLGDFLVVAINSDESVKLLKGSDRPINNQNDRKFFLESLKYVDKVFVFDEDTPYNLIKNILPDLIVKGGDYAPEDVIGNNLCRVVIFDVVEGYSTTKKIQDIIDR